MLNQLLRDVAFSLSPGQPTKPTTPIQGLVLSFAPEDWPSEVARLETTLAVWAVGLLPAWGVPLALDTLVYVPEDDVPGATDQGCPATHRVEFHPSFAVFVDRTTDFYAWVVPLTELMAGVVARAGRGCRLSACIRRLTHEAPFHV